MWKESVKNLLKEGLTGGSRWVRVAKDSEGVLKGSLR